MARRLLRAAVAIGVLVGVLVGLVVVVVGVPGAFDLLRGRDVRRAPQLTAGEVASRAGEVAMFSSHKNRGPNEYYRDAHAKAHGCVRAVVKVLPKTSKYRQGLFRDDATHLAWVRFSKGDPAIGTDEDDDAHGLAIKVLNVPEKGQSQDFLMINHPTFFVSYKEDYLEFVTKRSRGHMGRYFFSGANPFRWRLRQLWNAYQMLNHDIESVLHIRYHGMSTYRMGDGQIARFRAVPCASNRDEEGEIPFVDDIPSERPNHLRDRMQRYLREYRACFRLEFQVAKDTGERGDDSPDTPKHDITVEWPDDPERWKELARVTIPNQEFDTPQQNAFCEDLSFSPYRGLPEHEPVGEINELRKHVYKALYAFRSAQNQQPPYRDPCDWCDSPDWDCPDAQGGQQASCRSEADQLESARCRLHIAPAPDSRVEEELPWLTCESAGS